MDNREREARWGGQADIHRAVTLLWGGDSLKATVVTNKGGQEGKEEGTQREWDGNRGHHNCANCHQWGLE